MERDALPERPGVFTLRELAERVAAHHRIGVAAGKQRVELLFEDGRLVTVFTHHMIGGRELGELLIDLSPSSRAGRDD